MTEISAVSHATTVEVQAGWEAVFDYLQDLNKLGDWSLGCRDPKPQGEDGLYCGSSMFGDGPVYVKVEANRSFRVIDYLVGDWPDLSARISARVIPGAFYGKGAENCLVTLSAWRASQMSDDRWRQLVACHEAEIMLIKALIEGARP